jgi:hypothetical protein
VITLHSPHSHLKTCWCVNEDKMSKINKFFLLEDLVFQAYIVFDGMAYNNFSKSSERQSSKEIMILHMSCNKIKKNHIKKNQKELTLI